MQREEWKFQQKINVPKMIGNHTFKLIAVINENWN